MGVENKKEVFREYLRTSKFSIVNKGEAAKKFNDTHNNGNALTFKALMDHTTADLKPLAKKVLANILGIAEADIKDDTPITVEQLGQLFVTLGFLGSVTEPEKIFDPARGIKQIKDVSTDSFLKWYVEGKVEEKKGEDTSSRESGDAFEKGTRAVQSGKWDEAITELEKALSGADGDKKKTIRGYLILAYTKKLEEFKEKVGEMNDAEVVRQTEACTRALAKLEEYHVAGTYDLPLTQGREETEAGIDRLLQKPEKWDDKDISARNIRGYLAKLSSPTDRARIMPILKLEAKYFKFLREHQTDDQYLAGIARQFDTLRNSASAADRQEAIAKLARYAGEFRDFITQNSAPPTSSIFKEIDSKLTQMYYIIISLEPTPQNFGLITSYYDMRTSAIGDPKTEEEAKVYEIYGQFTIMMAEAYYKLSKGSAIAAADKAKYKKRAIELARKAAGMYEKAKLCYEKLKKVAEESIIRSTSDEAEKIRLNGQVERFKEKLGELQKTIKALRKGDPFAGKGVQDIVRGIGKNFGMSGERGGSTDSGEHGGHGGGGGGDGRGGGGGGGESPVDERT